MKRRVGATWVLVLASCGAASAPAPYSSSAAHAAEPRFAVGPAEDVLRPYAFGLTDLPDGLIATYRHAGRRYWLLGAFAPDDRTRTYTFRFTGETAPIRPDPIDEAGNAAPVLSPGPPGSFDDHIAGNGSVYLDTASGRLFYWYQAMHNLPEDVSAARETACDGNFYAAYGGIGLAVSGDGGRTWERRGIVLALRISEARFAADPSICYADPTPPSVVRVGDELRMYYAEFDTAEAAAGAIAVARLPIADLDQTPQPWRKRHDGGFPEPGLGGRFTAVAPAAAFPSVVWSPALGRWLMAYNGAQTEILLRTSEDGIHWSDLVDLVRSNDRTWLAHPTLVDDGDDLWLYYCHAPNDRADPGGWLVRRRVRSAGR